MKVIVINSFENFPTQPPINTPFISGLLKSKGFDIFQIDMNLEVWEELLCVNTIEKLHFNSESLNFYIRYDLPKLNRHSFNLLKQEVIVNIEQIKIIYRTKSEFYKLEKIAWADNQIQKIQVLYFYSTCLYIGYHHTIFAEDEDLHLSFSKMKFFSEKKENMFFPIMSSVLTKYLNRSEKYIFLVEAIFSSQFPILTTLIKVINSFYNDSHVCFSGFGFDQIAFARIRETLSINPDAFLGFDSIFLVRNDESILKLIDNLNSNIPINQIPSICVKSSVEIIQNEPITEQYTSEAVLPDLTDLSLEKYYSPLPVIIDRYSTRCFWSKCTFCSINAFKGKNINLNDEEFLIRIEHYLYKFNTNHIFLLDEAPSPKQILRITNIFANSNKDFTWSIRTRLDKELDKDTLTYMYEKGCRELWMGLESVSPSLLSLMNKTSDPNNYESEAKRIVEDCVNIGIGIHFCVILGFPGETLEDHKKLINFFSSMTKSFSKMPTFVSFNDFHLSPFSPMWKNPNKFGITINNYSIDRNNMQNADYSINDLSTIDMEILKASKENTVKQIVNILCPNKDYQNLWYSMTDSCHELLFKSFFKNMNPFFLESTNFIEN